MFEFFFIFHILCRGFLVFGLVCHIIIDLRLLYLPVMLDKLS
jgi:hypothetical protein